MINATISADLVSNAMKKYNLSKGLHKVFMLLLFLTGAGAAKPLMAQTHEFAPMGAEWYYAFQGHWIDGYVRMVSLGDTVMEGYYCRMINKDLYIYSVLYDSLYHYTIGNEFVMQRQDSVFLYRNGHFCPLFDFGAEIGDTWVVPGTEEYCDESFGIVHVVGNGREDINGHILRYVLVVDDPDSDWGYAYYSPSDTIKIVESIGPIGTYMFPEQRCEIDVSEGGPLRCYQDGEIGPVSYFFNNCDYINDIYQSCDEEPNNDWIVFPNPVKDGFFIRVQDSEGIVEVLDGLGRKVYSGAIDKEMNYISISHCSQGLYHVRIMIKSLVHNKLLMKM